MIEPTDTIISGKKSTAWVNEIFQKRGLGVPNYISINKPEMRLGTGGFICSISVVWNNEPITVEGGLGKKLQDAKDLAATALLRALTIDKYFLLKLSQKSTVINWPIVIVPKCNNENTPHTPIEVEHMDLDKEVSSPIDVPVPCSIKRNIVSNNNNNNATNTSNTHSGCYVEVQVEDAKVPEAKIPKLGKNVLVPDQDPQEFGPSDESVDSKYGTQWLDEFLIKASGKFAENPIFEKEHSKFKCTLSIIIEGNNYSATGYPQARKKPAQHSASFALLRRFGFNKSNLSSINTKDFRRIIEKTASEPVSDSVAVPDLSPEREPETTLEMDDIISKLEELEDKLFQANHEPIQFTHTVIKAECQLTKAACFNKIVHVHHKIGRSLVGNTLQQILANPTIVNRGNVINILDQLIREQPKDPFCGTKLEYKNQSNQKGGWFLLRLTIPRFAFSDQAVIGFGPTEHEAKVSAAIKMLKLLLDFNGFQTEEDLEMECMTNRE